MTLQFNALTDPWLPLQNADGTTMMASFVDVMSGEKDAVDLDFPRDDFRIYARLLLSALVQALMPAKNNADLKQQLSTPRALDELMKRIEEVRSDFDLFGSPPFLQVKAPLVEPKKGAAPFVFGDADLYQPSTNIDAVDPPTALIILFVEQMYSGGAGRGYGAGPGGQPGALTLIDAGSVRRTAWANTLTVDRIADRPADGPAPWRTSPKTAPRGSIGLVRGLFWQPRGVWLTAVDDGVCSFSGRSGRRVRVSPLVAGSSVGADQTTWVLPCAPMAVNSQGLAPVRLRAGMPTWTGLAQLLQPLSNRKAKVRHPLEGPAPVLQQWRDVGWSPGTSSMHPRLLVLDFDRDKAKVKGCFFEAFPLTAQLDGHIADLRELVADAEDIARSLLEALTRAHDDQKRGGFAAADARAAYWVSTEANFHAWLDVATKDAGGERVDSASAAMRSTSRMAAMKLFDAHCEMSEWDHRKQSLIAVQRKKLRNRLWPRPKVASAPTTSRKPRTMKVSP